MAPRILRAGSRLSDLHLLDRLIRSRFWIGLIGVALIGIVAMQVTMLKLNTGIGRAIERVTVLERDNASLQADVSKLSSGDRIEAEGYRMGMVLAPVGDVRFLTAGRWDAARASRRIGPPAADLARTPSSPNSGATTASITTPTGTASAGANTTVAASTPTSTDSGASPASTIAAAPPTTTATGG